MTDKTTIHVIDDDAAMRDSLAFLLDVNGFRTEVHDSADAFLGSVAADAANCVISDIRMPGMNGIELVRTLRGRGASCAVILITGHGDVALAVEAMKAGAADFIEKPFDDACAAGSDPRGARLASGGRGRKRRAQGCGGAACRIVAARAGRVAGAGGGQDQQGHCP